MKTTLSKLILPVLLLLLTFSVLTSFTTAKIANENGSQSFALVEGQDCYYQGSVFIGKATTGASCFCYLTFSHFEVFCDTRYYDACRLIMCSGDPCCRSEFPE